MPQTVTALRRVRGLEITTRQLVEGLVSGGHDSVFRGRGIAFSEIREYRHGDDVRTIDWNVTARFNRPYVKEYIEERDLQVYVVVDVSASGSFGGSLAKRDRAVEVAAALMFAAQQSNDRAGMFLVSDHIEMFVPARRGRRHVMQALLKMVSHEAASRATDLRACIESMAGIVKRRSVIIVVSDMMDDGDYAKPLRHLARRHDIAVVRVTDERERNMPDVGLIELEDSETGEQVLVNTSDEEFRAEYARLVERGDAALAATMARCRVDRIDIGTDGEYAARLLRFFQTRRRRRH